MGAFWGVAGRFWAGGEVGVASTEMGEGLLFLRGEPALSLGRGGDWAALAEWAAAAAAADWAARAAAANLSMRALCSAMMSAASGLGAAAAPASRGFALAICQR